MTARPHLLHPRSAPWPYPGLWMSQIPQDHTSPSPLPPGEAAARLSPEGNSGMTTAWAEGTCPPAPTCLCWHPAQHESSSLGLPRAGAGAGRAAWHPAPWGRALKSLLGALLSITPAPSLGRLGSRGMAPTRRSLGVWGWFCVPGRHVRGASRLLPLAAGHPLPMQGTAAPRRAAQPRSAPSSTFLLLPAERGKREQGSLHLPLVGTGRTGDPFSPARGGAGGGGAAGPVPLPCPSPAPRGAALLTVRSLHLSA